MFHSMLINVHEIWLSTVKDAFDSFCMWNVSTELFGSIVPSVNRQQPNIQAEGQQSSANGTMLQLWRRCLHDIDLKLGYVGLNVYQNNGQSQAHLQ